MNKTAWFSIDLCPVEQPVLVVVDDVVQHAVMQRLHDGTWEEVSCGHEFDNFEPSFWRPLPVYSPD